MAFATIEFASEAMNRNVEFRAIIPQDTLGKQPLKTLYLLHGAYGRNTDWLYCTRIGMWAQQKNLAVIMPSGENHFYVDNPETQDRYSTYVGEELVEFTRSLFPLSHEREDTFIAGLSMGGYGALVNGLKYFNTFGSVAALSASLRVPDYKNSNDDAETYYLRKRSYLRSVFGDVNAVEGSAMDYRHLAASIPAGKFPRLYLCCGLDDELLPHNRRFRDFLTAQGLPFTYEEGPGDHDWEFWDTYIRKILDWLPLEESK